MWSISGTGMLGADDVHDSQQGTVGDTFDIDDARREFYVALATGLAGLLISLLSGLYSCIVDRKLKEYEARAEVRKQRLTRVEDVKELMKQYKKPLVQSAFDLQSRLSQEVKANLLRKFGSQGPRRREYVRLSSVYLICEFLGWLEVMRQEVVFITGERAATLTQILDAIKFQFSGETCIQGVDNGYAPQQENVDVGEQNWSILQLFGVELRAIGEVMIDVRSYDDSNGMSSSLSVMGYAEFTRRFTKEAPAPGEFGLGAAAAAGSGLEGSDEAKAKYAEAMERWNDSREKLLQDTVRPLARSVDKLMDLPPEARHANRIVMLQVLLCNLIDFLDNGERSDENHECEERYLARNDRITPLVAQLSPSALEWLASQPFMEDCTEAVDPRYRAKWLEMVGGTGWVHEGVPEAARVGAGGGIRTEFYRRVAFPGFREDSLRGWKKLLAARAAVQHRRGTSGDRDAAVRTFRKLQPELVQGGAFFPGAFPPKIRRSTLRSLMYRIRTKLKRLQAALGSACILFNQVPPQEEGPLMSYERDLRRALNPGRATQSPPFDPSSPLPTPPPAGGAQACIGAQLLSGSNDGAESDDPSASSTAAAAAGGQLEVRVDTTGRSSGSASRAGAAGGFARAAGAAKPPVAARAAARSGDERTRLLD